MKRIDSTNARPNINGTGKAGFSDNADLSGQDATYLTPDWLNTVQEEICNLLEKNSVKLGASKKDQLFNLLVTYPYIQALEQAIEERIVAEASLSKKARDELQAQITALLNYVTYPRIIASGVFLYSGRALLHKDLKCKAPLIEPNLRRNLGKWST